MNYFFPLTSGSAQESLLEGFRKEPYRYQLFVIERSRAMKEPSPYYLAQVPELLIFGDKNHTNGGRSDSIAGDSKAGVCFANS